MILDHLVSMKIKLSGKTIWARWLFCRDREQRARHTPTPLHLLSEWGQECQPHYPPGHGQLTVVCLEIVTKNLPLTWAEDSHCNISQSKLLGPKYASGCCGGGGGGTEFLLALIVGITMGLWVAVILRVTHESDSGGWFWIILTVNSKRYLWLLCLELN